MNDDSSDENNKLRSNVTEWVKSIAVALATAFFVTTFIFNAAVVKGNSMNPTLEENDRLIVKKYETKLKTEEYKRGDLVVFESPLENDDQNFIKRVIGIPGDKINIRGGKLYINDIKVEEPYLPEDSYTEPLLYGDAFLVPENELFVMGDNRRPNKSNDSRSFGSISFDHIEGKIVLRILPFDKIDTHFK